jgi:hypothetical protein
MHMVGYGCLLRPLFAYLVAQPGGSGRIQRRGLPRRPGFKFNELAAAAAHSLAGWQPARAAGPGPGPLSPGQAAHLWLAGAQAAWAGPGGAPCCGTVHRRGQPENQCREARARGSWFFIEVTNRPARGPPAGPLHVQVSPVGRRRKQLRSVPSFPVTDASVSPLTRSGPATRTVTRTRRQKVKSASKFISNTSANRGLLRLLRKKDVYLDHLGYLGIT